jgi:hypothetical protein
MPEVSVVGTLVEKGYARTRSSILRVMSPTAMLIVGIIQVCIAPALIIGRRPIADWLSNNVPPLDLAWFHVRGGLFMTVAGVLAAISGGIFVGMGVATLAWA